MSVLIYSLGDTWRPIVGNSDVTQTDFKNRVVSISEELRASYDLVEKD